MNQIIDYRNHLEEVDKFITNEAHQCLFVGCTEKAVGSHAIQKKGPLKKIADKDFVYCLDSSLSRSFDVKNQTNSIKFRKTPISKATTFPGFCDYHEKLFHTFETPGLNVSNKKHLLYLYYRTLGYEIVKQRISTKRLEIRLRRLYLSSMISKAMGNSESITEADIKETLEKNLSTVRKSYSLFLN
ncbi:hypothetical protein [Shewanella algae]|uniref:hypothetical protein n=1 Tax=Shewanella algae TaxID=38313 RepID=UPI0031F5995A